MIPSWEEDPFGFFLAIAIMGFGLTLLSTLASMLGVDIEQDVEPPESPSFSWWVTEGPKFYPNLFASGAFLLMIAVFKLYMHVW